MKPLQDWIKDDLKELKKIPRTDYNDMVFHRDPIRTIIVDNGFFFAPADGTILYATAVGPDDQILDIKGKQFSLRDLMQQPVAFRALVVGIFLSQYDVHISRIPYSGFFYYKKLDKITTTNRPMVQEEKDIFEGLIDPSHEDYSFTNERYLWEVHVPRTGYKYYMIAIADKEVDVIAHHYQSGKFLSQNTRTATIKYGSQVDLILPLDVGMNFEPLVSRGWHVESGVDPLVRIEKINNNVVKKAWQLKSVDTVIKQINNVVEQNDPVKEHTELDGLSISLEWLDGEERHWKDEKHKCPMVGTHYGFINNTLDGDGMEVDIYLAANSEEGLQVYRIDQLKKDGTFDEHKWMLGFKSEKTAKKAYLEAMPKWMFGSIVEMSMDDFKDKFLKFHRVENND